MSDSFSTHRDECKCSHAKTSHHDSKYGCLAARCDCSKYVNAFKPTGSQLAVETEAPLPTTPTDHYHDDWEYGEQDYDYYPPPSY